MSRRLPLLLLLAACCGVPALTDEAAVIPGESKPMATRLDEARKLLAKKEPAKAVKLLHSVIEGGTELVALKNGRSVRARWLANAAIARLDADTLKSYRDRAEPAAKKLLAQATEERDAALWRRIVDEAFCTKSALSALDSLGDRAFERGRFDEACEWWGLIAALDGGRKKDDPDDLLLYPDPTVEQAARARAKQLLARLFRGGDATLADDFARFRKMHPGAEGRLAGKEGVYVERLKAVAKERAARKPILDDEWPTFAGNGARGRVAVAAPRLLDHLSQLCRPGPTWRFNLLTRKKLDKPLPVGNESTVTRARRMAFHPVVPGQVALVADNRRVTAYDLKTGKVYEWYDADKYVGGIRSGPPALDQRYTLTVAEDCVYARLGTQYVRDVRPGDKKQNTDDTESILVCLNLEAARDGDRRRWMVRATDVGRKEYAVFEGAPLVSDGRVYIAATRFEGDKVITAIHCYPANPEDSAPAPLWRVDVCETRELLPAESGGNADLSKKQRSRHHLLTLAGPRVVYCSHSGAIVAVDAVTGQRAWAVRYPRREISEPDDAPVLRDLAPCLYADGKLFAAPADSDRLLCLDPATGRTLWKRDHLDVVHLLGVGQGRLIFTTYRNPREGQLHAGGLRAVGADDGGDEDGWSLPDDGGGLVPLGRGLLVGDLVLWPTARKPYGVFAVRQKDGRQPDNPSLLHRLPAGNLLYASGATIVTDERTMEAFVPPQWLDEDEEQEIKSDDESLVRGMRIARASVGRDDRGEAVKRFDAVRKAIDADSPGSLGRRLLGESRRERTEALLHLKRGKEAERDETPRGRLRIAVAAKEWDAIRRSKELRWLSVEDERGLPASAATLATRQIGERHGGARRNKAKPPKRLELAWPLVRRWQIDLAKGESLLPLDAVEGPALGRVWSVRGVELRCRSAETGKVMWRCTLPFVVDRRTAVGDVVVAGGPKGIVGVGPDGAIEWVFPAPVIGREPATTGGIRVVRNGRRGGSFAMVGVADGRVLCLQDRRRLLAIEGRTGRVAWQWWAPGAAFEMPFPRGSIGHVQTLGERVLVQASGRVWLLDEEGEVVAKHPCSLEPWTRPAVRVDQCHWCLVPNRDRVQLLDIETGKMKWTATMPGKTLRSRVAPLVLVTGKGLRLILPLNIGCQWWGVDRETGKLSRLNWPLLDLDRLDAKDWTVNGPIIYHAGKEKLTAHDAGTGKVLWSRPLAGASSWRMEVGKELMWLWPRRAPAGGFQFRWLGGAVQWRTGAWPDAAGGTAILCVDSRTGEAVQRLNLTAGVVPWRWQVVRRHGVMLPSVVTDIDPQGAAGPVVQRLGTGLAIGQAGRAWALGSETADK